MPKIRDLPGLDNGITGLETVPLVNTNDETVQTSSYRFKYNFLSTNTNVWYVTCYSTDSGNNTTTLAGFEFYEKGQLIPFNQILSIEFDRDPPISSTGDINHLIDGDPDTYFTFQENFSQIGCFKITFNDNVRIDQVNIVAPSISSGVPIGQLPNSISVDTGAYYVPNNTPEYYFQEVGFTDWTLGETKSFVSPPIVIPFDPLRFIVQSSVVPPVDYFLTDVVDSTGVTTIRMIHPFIRAESYSELMNTSGNSDNPINSSKSDVEFKIDTHKSVTLIANGDFDLSGMFYTNGNNYAITKVVCVPNGTNASIYIYSSNLMYPGRGLDPYQVGVEKTFFNVSETHTVTLVPDGFTTIIDMAPLVIPPKSKVTIMEYAEDALLVY